MPCNCGGGQGVQPGQSPQQQGAQSVLAQLADNDMAMVRYMHPNRGQHPVYGIATKTFYGMRPGGGQEEFLVHRADIAAMPHYFHVVSQVPAPPQVKIPMPPPPAPVAPPKPSPTEEVEALETPPPPIATKVLNAVRFDLQLLPGVTPAIAKGLAEAKLDSVESILAAGPKGLEKVKYVGEAKALIIHKYVKDNYGDTDVSE